MFLIILIITILLLTVAVFCFFTEIKDLSKVFLFFLCLLLSFNLLGLLNIFSTLISISFKPIVIGVFLISIILIFFNRQKLHGLNLGLSKALNNYVPFTIFLFFVFILSFKFSLPENSIRWGHWDAWAIWSLHAKFLLFSDGFGNLFTSPEIAWSHPDYPLMLPSIISMFWKSVYYATPIVPSVLAYLIMLFIVIFIYSTFNFKTDSFFGLIAVMWFSFDIWFIKLAASQYSDTLLSLFILITIIIASQNDKKESKVYFLLGLFCGLCGWIKNEGLIFTAVFSGLFLVSHVKKIGVLKRYFFGLLIPMVIIIGYKLMIKMPNDLMDKQSTETIKQIFHFERYYQILNYLINLLTFKYNYFIPLAVISFFVSRKQFISVSFLALSFTFAIYLFIYIITPYDLPWHLDTSFERLFHQVYSGLIYLFILNISQRLNSSNLGMQLVKKEKILF